MRKDGALFFVRRRTPSADDKDRVVQKTDGAYTYFASRHRLLRRQDRHAATTACSSFLGADHHGYVARVRNALEALGLPSERFEALLYQLVFIYRGGELVKIGKRAGNIVTVEEVIEEIDEAAGAQGRGARRAALLLPLAERQHERRVRHRSREEEARSTTPSSTSSTATRGSARSSGRRRRSASRRRRPLTRRGVGEARPPRRARASRTALSEFPDVLRDAATGARAAPDRLLRAGAGARVPELLHPPEGRTRSSRRPRQREAAGWEASWDFGKTRARLAWIEAIRTVYAAALDLLGVERARADGPAEGRQRRRPSPRLPNDDAAPKKWRSA